jgi:hypothetical protein
LAAITARYSRSSESLIPQNYSKPMASVLTAGFRPP